MSRDDYEETSSNDSKVKCKLGINKSTGRLQWCPQCNCSKILIVLLAAMIPLLLFFTLLIHLDLVGTTTSPENGFNESTENQCISVQIDLSETLDVEETGILKDVRTSFIPPKSVTIPKNCNTEDFLIKETESSLIWTDTDFVSFLKRLRRSENGHQFLEKEFHEFWKGEGSFEKIRSTQVDIMKKYMDHTADPCNDFYQYACGNWEKLNPIPRDKAVYDTFEILRESLDTVLKDLLTKPLTTTEKPNPNRISKRNVNILNKIIASYRRRYKRDSSSSDAELKAQNLYESCMNDELLSKRGIEPLLSLLDSLGGWPVISPNWNESKFDWLSLTAQLRRYNNDILIVEWVGPDIKNSNENIIQFDQTSLGLPTRDYFLLESNRHYLEAYQEYMRTIISLLGADSETAERTTKEIIDFEIELAKVTSSPAERTNVTLLYTKMTIEELHNEISEIDWQRYLTILYERPVQTSEVIVIFSVNYMHGLVKLLAKTEKKTIANYLLWRFVRHRVNNLDLRFQEAKQVFFKVLFGREESPPRWKFCVYHVNANMGMAIGAMFVRKYFDENSKQDTLFMTNALQQAFREILNEIDWIDPTTKRLAELKINAISLKIGYPDYILSHEELNKKYEDLHIDRSKYFENTLNVLLHLTKTEHNKLGKLVDKSTWHTAPAVVNAYYSRNKNQIMFPAGILQPPFYHRYFPKSLNYGGIGVVIGHELTHGFDDKGRLFDKDGNLHRWFSENSIQNFYERATCLVSQYSNYTVPEVGIAVDGFNTQGENIADNGGIKQAFLAYKKYLKDNKDDEQIMRNEQLPGMNATNSQLFFLNFAQIWCGAMRPEATRSKLKTAVHSPGKFRVIGTLSNYDEFAKEYNCPIGSPMNPVNKCTVW